MLSTLQYLTIPGVYNCHCMSILLWIVPQLFGGRVGNWGDLELTCQTEPKQNFYALVVAVIIVITDGNVMISPTHVVCSHDNNFKDVVLKFCLKEFKKIVYVYQVVFL